jgi:hypothetical protein
MAMHAPMNKNLRLGSAVTGLGGDSDIPVEQALGRRSSVQEFQCRYTAGHGGEDGQHSEANIVSDPHTVLVLTGFRGERHDRCMHEVKGEGAKFTVGPA